jgi:TetR/AcrR family transcriptional regulator, transcriptional repressor for nem operon
VSFILIISRLSCILKATLAAGKISMPRASREQSTKHREQILREAARAFRERGFDDVSVADLMARAGLTHGGFYGHFASKQALEAQACAHASEKTTARWHTIVDNQPDSAKARREIIETS